MRNFGIEIECYHPTLDSYTSRTELAGDIIIKFPGVVAARASYTGRRYEMWQLKEDMSLSPSGRALEVVSRILKGEEGIVEARGVADILFDKGYRVNASCGLHVHMDVSDLTWRQRVAVALRWHYQKEEIKTFLPPSRWNGMNVFASFWDANESRKLYDAVVECDESEEWDHDERRVPVNLEYMTSRDTIEFRQAAGTVNADKIENWVRFLNEFIDDTKRVMIEFEQVEEAYTSRPVPARITNPVPIQNPPRQPVFRSGSRSEWLYRLFKTRIVVKYEDLARVVDPSVHCAMTRTQFTDTIAALKLQGVNITRMAGSDARYYYTPNAPQIVAPLTLSTSYSSQTSAPKVEDYLKRPITLTEKTAAWVKSRKAVFAEDVASVR